MSTATLFDLIPGWPAGAPAQAVDLIFFENEEIDELQISEEQRQLIFGLRKQVRRAVTQRGTSTPLGNSEAVARAIETNDIRLVGKRWLTLVLDRHRRRVFSTVDGGVRTVVRVSPLVPSPDDLPPLPYGGVYLLIYGGGPEVLDISDARRRLVELQAAVPVADVLFRKLETGCAPALFSAREGCGDQASCRVEFPNQNHLQEVSLW